MMEYARLAGIAGKKLFLQRFLEFAGEKWDDFKEVADGTGPDRRSE
jgi:hypothetical protein